MLQKKNRNILIYFFLFFIFGTLNNKNSINLNFEKWSEINVEGLDDHNNFDLKKNLEDLKIKNSFLLDRNKINKIILSNSLVEKYSVFKIYPSKLYIKIDKTEFLARLKRNGEDFFLGSNGKLIEIKEQQDDLPFIFGNFKNENFFELKKAIDETNFSYSRIKELFFFKLGRWDIKTDTGTIIKLPKYNLKKSLELSIKILLEDDKKKINEIDLRQNNQIIING